MFKTIFRKERTDRASRAKGHVIPDPSRCVQCGICSYNCPMEIDVRSHAWTGEPVIHSHCLSCGECVNRCPRGVLRLEKLELFASDKV